MTKKPNPIPNEKNFLEELEEFRNRWPMVYVEAWNPEDFEPGSLWEKPGHVEIAERLYENHDAGTGTNWDTLNYVQQELKDEAQTPQQNARP